MGASVDLSVPEDASLDAFDSDESADAESVDSASETEEDRKPNSDKSGSDEPTPDEPNSNKSGSNADESDSNKSDSNELDFDDSIPADSAISTFDWSPESGECADCGGSVVRRWRAEGERGGALVCADCKQW